MGAFSTVGIGASSCICGVATILGRGLSAAGFSGDCGGGVFSFGGDISIAGANFLSSHGTTLM